MDRYFIITTLCDKEEIANRITDTLLEKKLVSGSQISKVHSKWWWNNRLEENDEYKVEFRTKESLLSQVENEIKKIHDYEVPEISYYEINSTNSDFKKWIDENTKPF